MQGCQTRLYQVRYTSWTGIGVSYLNTILATMLGRDQARRPFSLSWVTLGVIVSVLSRLGNVSHDNARSVDTVTTLIRRFSVNRWLPLVRCVPLRSFPLSRDRFHDCWSSMSDSGRSSDLFGTCVENVRDISRARDTVTCLHLCFLIRTFSIQKVLVAVRFAYTSVFSSELFSIKSSGMRRRDRRPRSAVET